MTPVTSAVGEVLGSGRRHWHWVPPLDGRSDDAPDHPGIGNMADVGAPVSLLELTMMQKRIQGSLYGENSPQDIIPKLLRCTPG